MSSEIYILGASGQVGGEIQRIFPEGYFLTRKDIDLSSPESIQRYFKNKSPKLIVNCSAYTQVDLAESESELAHLVNGVAPGILASISDKFIHFSTDYVFDGKSHDPYCEDDPTDPSSVYGRSKLEGENRALLANSNTVIIRTSWVYSDIGKNFVKTMLRLGREKSELKVVSDQSGSPTYAADLASLVVEHGIKNWNFKSNVYHYSNEGQTTWFDFAMEIMRQKDISCQVLPIPTSDYPTPAKRPAYSLLNKNKIKTDLQIEIPDWKESLKICLQKLS